MTVTAALCCFTLLGSVHFLAESQSYHRLNHPRWHLDALFSDRGKRFDTITQEFLLINLEINCKHKVTFYKKCLA